MTEILPYFINWVSLLIIPAVAFFMLTISSGSVRAMLIGYFVFAFTGGGIIIAVYQNFLNSKKVEVYEEISQENGLHIETGTKLKCVSGYWLHKPEWSEHFWHFDPKVSCAHDRGIEKRLKEKWPDGLHFPSESFDENTDLDSINNK